MIGLLLFLVVSIAVSIYFNRLQNTAAKLFRISKTCHRARASNSGFFLAGSLILDYNPFPRNVFLEDFGFKILPDILP